MKKKVEIIVNRLYKRELENYAREMEEKKEIFSSSHANFDMFNHNMLVGEELEKVYEELSDLEKADLIDYCSLEKNERTNKKR